VVLAGGPENGGDGAGGKNGSRSTTLHVGGTRGIYGLVATGYDLPDVFALRSHRGCALVFQLNCNDLFAAHFDFDRDWRANAPAADDCSADFAVRPGAIPG